MIGCVDVGLVDVVVAVDVEVHVHDDDYDDGLRAGHDAHIPRLLGRTYVVRKS